MPSNDTSRVSEFGALLVTPGALQALDDAGESPLGFIHRYLAGDLSDLVGNEQAAVDAFAADEGKPVVGYALSTGVKLWLIVAGQYGLSVLIRPEER